MKISTLEYIHKVLKQEEEDSDRYFRFACEELGKLGKEDLADEKLKKEKTETMQMWSKRRREAVDALREFEATDWK